MVFEKGKAGHKRTKTGDDKKASKKSPVEDSTHDSTGVHLEAPSTETAATTNTVKTRGKRSVVKIYKVLVKKATNKKVSVKYNKRGNPCGKTRAALQSYVGMLARTMVPINIESWPKVGADLKEKLWKDIQDTFKVVPESRRLILSSAGVKWRQFKTYLTNNEVLPHCGNKKKLRNPPKKYAFVGKDVWREFVKSRCTDEWMEKHRKQSEVVKKRRYHHRTSRSGYIGVEEKMKEAQEVGSDDEVDRLVMRKKAHVPKDGNVDDDLKPILEKIDDLLEKQKNGELLVEGSNDILTQALGNPEHSGRVRGVGGFVTPTNYFGLPKQRRIHITKAELLAQDKERELELQKTKKLLAEHEAKTQQLIAQPLADFEARMVSGKCKDKTTEPEATPVMTPLSDKGSHYDITTSLDTGDCLPRPPSSTGNDFYEFALDDINNVVAFGTVLRGDGLTTTIHGRPWPEGCIRASIVGEIQGDEPLPYPIPDAKILLVRDAVGTTVAWPEKWVLQSMPLKPRKKSKEPKKLFNEAEIPASVPKRCNLLYKHATVTMRETCMSITKALDEKVFGVPKQLIVLRENVIDMLELKWIGSGVIDAYMVYLHGLIRKEDELDLYGFVDSGATFQCTRPGFVPYLVQRLKQGSSDRILMIPHNPGQHWILTVIWEGDILIIDSMARPSPYKDWENAVKLAVKDYNVEMGNGAKMPKGAPAQPGGYECGYYVMRFMREIIFDDTLCFHTEWAVRRNRKSYTQQEVDEVRIELAHFLWSLI